jgi:hypothetical protein
VMLKSRLALKSSTWNIKKRRPALKKSTWDVPI